MTSMWFPRQVSSATSGAQTAGDIVTAHATINTKGSWVQLLTATAFDAYYLEVFLAGNSLGGTNTRALVDIGVDPAGSTSYTIYVNNILAGARGGLDAPSQFTIPIYIPAGSTVAARSQSVITVATVEVGVSLSGGTPSDRPFPPQGLIVTYGVTTSASQGVVQNDSAGEGAWAEIIGSTTHPHRGVAVGIQGSGETVSSNGGWSIDVAIGAGGSEVAILEDLFFRTQSNEKILGMWPGLWFVERPIPEGSRLSARIDGVTNQQKDYDIALYGWG